MKSTDDLINILDKKFKGKQLIDVYDFIENLYGKKKIALEIGYAKQFRGYNFIKFGIIQ